MGIDYRASIVKPEAARFQTILLKGPSGTGKTFQLRKLVEAGMKGLYLDSEDKRTSLAGVDVDVWPITQSDFPLKPADKKPEVQDLMRAVDFLRTADHGYDFVYLDSGMQYAENLLDYLENTRGLSGMDLWGVFAKKLEKGLKALAKLSSTKWPKPVHVITTWGVERDKDWAGTVKAVLLVDGQKVKPKVDFWFDHVLYLEILDDVMTGNSDFVLHTKGTSRFDAKISGGEVKFDSPIKNPNLAEIIRKIQEANVAPTSK